MNSKSHKRKIAAAAIALVFLLLSVGCVNQACSWGDDFAAYILEAIAITENNLEQQAKINYFLHPAPLSEEASEGELVYALGFPVILSDIYRIFGYDLVNYSSIFYYKIPSILGFGLLAGVLFLFYEKRLGGCLGVLLTVAVCSYIQYYYIINNVMTDVIFLLLSFASLALESVWTENRTKNRTPLCLLFALLLWLTYEVRLNGILVLTVCAVNQLVSCRKKREPLCSVINAMMPFLICVYLIFITECIVLCSPTGEASFIGKGSVDTIRTYLGQYAADIWANLSHAVDSIVMTPVYTIANRLFPEQTMNGTVLSNVLTGILMILAVIGLFRMKSSDIYLMVFAVLLFIGSGLYFHDERYIFPIIPVVYLLIGNGIRTISDLVQRKFNASGFSHTSIASIKWISTGAVCFLLLFPVVKYAGTIEFFDNTEYGAYSDEAKEIYAFIASNTEDNQKVAFFRPRCLYLNTRRLSFVPGVNGHDVSEADYFLRFKYEGELHPVETESFLLLYENDSFEYYKVR